MEKYKEVERSIIKKYRREIWKRFTAAIVRYKLIEKGDKIAVCISGGKDSMLMAKCMQELQRHGLFYFDLEFLVMDPGYAPANRRLIESNAELLNIPIRVFESDIFEIVSNVDKSPCYLCARMRRGYLYSRAKALGCNKIALGHHFDDVVETILMSMLYSGEIRTMMPKLHSTNFEGMQLIRPMYMIKEADIISWARYNGLSFLQCACRMTESAARGDVRGTSKRVEMKELVKNLRKLNPFIDHNIFTSVENVNIDTVVGYRKGGEYHHFLDDYDSARQ